MTFSNAMHICEVCVDVRTGKVAQNPTVGVECYPVEVRGDEIFVNVGG